MLDQIVIVLYQPRDVVNIGGVVRAMKNMGLHRLRLVEPVPFVPDDILRLAHRSDDLLATLQIYPDLDAALADAIFVVGASEHCHAEHPIRSDIRALAQTLLQRSAGGPVALLFGPEDNGLSKRELDRCHTIVRLPIDPDYPSLNLAQAALLLMYELRMAASDVGLAHAVETPTPHITPHDQAARFADLETLFTTAEQALQVIGFFKIGSAAKTLRALRQIIHRAEPSQREVALLTAMAREVVKCFQRQQ
jgi:tRNA/rRNA methyltransferase